MPLLPMIQITYNSFVGDQRTGDSDFKLSELLYSYPQGSVLGPITFMYNDKMFFELMQENIRNVTF